MAGPFTVDASVFLNGFNPAEEGHATSLSFLLQLQDQAVPIIVPTLLLPEVAVAIGRGQANADLARQFADSLSQLPHLVWVALDESLARQAIEVAAQFRLRGADAVYVAVALRFGCPLVTLDREQHDRAAKALQTFYPAEVGL
ncbi:MAG: type II toxin-antitoxin system VapC family toxin [Anaerolineales bacterium]|nr:type II toxin-antitoxin system VapC family toxin [Anaerolineales bacterium]